MNQNSISIEKVSTNIVLPYTFVLFADIEVNPTKSWLVQHVLGAGELSIFFGAPGSCKSVVLGDAACHVAAGMPWFDRSVEQGAVLYIAAERGSLVKRRMAAWRKAYDLHDLPLAVVSGSFSMASGTEDTLRIIATAKALENAVNAPVRWIIIDTKAQVMSGCDENSARDVSVLTANCSRIQVATGAHVTVVDHTPHEGNRSRGHGGLLGAADVTYRVSKSNGVRTITVHKVNDGPEDISIPFALETVSLGTNPVTGDVTTAPIVVALGAHTESELANTQSRSHRGSGLKPVEARALKLLQVLVAERGEVSPAGAVVSSDVRVVLESEWRQRCYDGAISEGTKEAMRKAFRRAADGLLASGLVKQSGRHVWTVS